MKFTDYGYREKDEKHKKVYCMTMGDMKINLLQYTEMKDKKDLKIRLVDVKAGEVEEYQSSRDFLMTDLNNVWEIELLDIHVVHSNVTNEDIIVACFRDDESGWEE